MLSTAALALAQRPVRRIGYLTLGSAEVSAAWLEAFRAGMLELRWVEGRDYLVDARYANGVTQALPGLASELVASRPDLLLTPADEGSRQLAQKTKTIPIVFAIAQDPVANGLAAGLRRPGGNVTGLTNLSSELWPKRLQLFKEVFPRVAHIGVLFEPDNVGSVSQAKEIEEAASRLGVRITRIMLRQPGDVEPGFKRAAAAGVQGYVLTQSGTINSQRHTIIDRINQFKAPSIFANSQYVEAGGLMSYSASFTDNFRRAATYADKILKGAATGELPVEQPTKFELVVNMKTAKAIGITFPEAFKIGVDRVIE